MLKGLTKYRDEGLLLLRIGIGLSYILLHGGPKLLGGPETWYQVGGAISSVGIEMGFVFWGLLAALAETLGGLLLIFGWFFRPALLLLLISMLVATLMQIDAGEDWASVVAHPLKMAILFFCWLFIGPGRMSIDGK